MLALGIDGSVYLSESWACRVDEPAGRSEGVAGGTMQLTPEPPR